MAQTDPPPADEGGAEGWVEGFDSAPGNLGPELYHVFDLALWRFAPAYDDLGALMGFLAWRLDADRLEPAVIDVVYHENRGGGTWPAYAIAGDDLGMMALAVQRLGGVVSDPFRGQEEIAAARAWAVEAEAVAAMLNVSGQVGPVGEPETEADALNLGSMIEGLVEGVAEGDMIASVVESAEDPVLTRAVFSTLGWRIVPPGGDVTAALTSGASVDDPSALLVGGSFGEGALNSFASMTEPIGYDDAGNPIYPGDEGGGIEELDDGCTELDGVGCEQQIACCTITQTGPFVVPLGATWRLRSSNDRPHTQKWKCVWELEKSAPASKSGKIDFALLCLFTCEGPTSIDSYDLLEDLLDSADYPNGCPPTPTDTAVTPGF